VIQPDSATEPRFLLATTSRDIVGHGRKKLNYAKKIVAKGNSACV
jgi:hypothetical protein